MAVSLQVKVKLDGKDETGEAFGKAKKNAEGLGSSITALSTGYLALADIVGKVMAKVAEPIKNAIEAEQAAQRLINTLKVANQYTEANVASLQAYSDQMEIAANVDGDLIDKLNTTNLLMLKNTEQAENLTSASIALAKATDGDVVGANNLLISSLQGQDRQLKKLLPEVGTFTDAQLRSGEAINLVNKRFSELITGDMNTTEGMVGRISKAFDKLAEDMGKAFLEGVKQSGLWDRIANKLGLVSDNAQEQADNWKALGKTVGDLADKYLDGLITALDLVVKSATAVMWIFQKAQTILDLFVDRILLVVNAIRIVITEFKALAAAGNRPLFTLKGGFKVTDIKEYTDAYKEFDAERAENYRAFEENGKSLLSGAKSLLGVQKEQAKVAKAAQFAPEPPKTTRFKANLGMDDSQLELQMGMQRQLNSEIQQLAMATSNQLVAESASRLQKVYDLEVDAARKGVNVTKEAEQLKLAIVIDFTRKLQEQRMQDAATITKASGRTADAIEADYELQSEAYRKMRIQDRITEKEYLEAVTELRRKANEDLSKTTGSASEDAAVNTANTFVNTIKGGLSAIITAIGDKLGPYGQLVASIINILNQPPDVFKAMINAIIEALKQLPDYVVDAIAILIEKIPEIYNALLGKLWSVSFWAKTAQALWNALIKMFENFWAYLFGGTLSSSVKNSQAAQKIATFGSDKEQAGENQFKIKDQDLANQRRVTQSFEQSFEETVDNSTKGFIGYLNEAWDAVIAKLREFFTNMWNALKQVFTDVWNQLLSWGQKIWDGIAKGAEAVGQWGAKIWEGLKSAASGTWEWLKSIGTQIWNGLFAGISAFWNTFYEAGKRVWEGFASLWSQGWNIMKNFGQSIWDGFKDAISGAGNILSDIGKKIAKAIGDFVSDALKGAFGGGGGGGGGSILDPGGVVSGIGHALGFAKGGYVSSSAAQPNLAKMFAAAGARRYAEGGMVPGTGFRDAVPAILMAGEQVLSRKQVAEANTNPSGVSVSFNFNVAAGAKLDREAVKEIMPQLITELKQASRNGTQIASTTGVYR